MDPPPTAPEGEPEDDASYQSAGDNLSRESSFLSAGDAFGTVSNRSGYASPDRQNLDGFTYQTDDIAPPEITTSPIPPKDNPANLGGSPRVLERFFSALPSFGGLSRGGSLAPGSGSQDLSGFMQSEGFERPRTGLGKREGLAVVLPNSNSLPDLRRSDPRSGPRRHSGPLSLGSGGVLSEALPSPPLLENEEEDYTFVRKWSSFGERSPSVRSSSIGGRSSSREVMQWMGEAGMLDEEDELIIYDEAQRDPPRVDDDAQRDPPKGASPRVSFGWWPFRRTRSQEGPGFTSLAASRDRIPSAEPSSESVSGPALESVSGPAYELAPEYPSPLGLPAVTSLPLSAENIPTGEPSETTWSDAPPAAISLQMNSSSKGDSVLPGAADLTVETGRTMSEVAGPSQLLSKEDSVSPGLAESTVETGPSLGQAGRPPLTAVTRGDPANVPRSHARLVSPGVSLASAPRGLVSDAFDTSEGQIVDVSNSDKAQPSGVSGTPEGHVSDVFGSPEGLVSDTSESVQMLAGDSKRQTGEEFGAAAAVPEGFRGGLLSGVTADVAGGSADVASRGTEGGGFLSLGIYDSADSVGEATTSELPSAETPERPLPSIPRSPVKSTHVKTPVVTPSEPAERLAGGEPGASVNTGLGARLGPVNTAFFTSQGMNPPTEEVHHMGNPATPTTGTLRDYPGAGHLPTDPSPRTTPLAVPPSIQPAAKPKDAVSGGVVKEGRSKSNSPIDTPPLSQPAAPDVNKPQQAAAAPSEVAVEGSRNRSGPRGSLGPVNTAFFASQGMAPPGGSQLVRIASKEQPGVSAASGPGDSLTAVNAAAGVSPSEPGTGVSETEPESFGAENEVGMEGSGRIEPGAESLGARSKLGTETLGAKSELGVGQSGQSKGISGDGEEGLGVAAVRGGESLATELVARGASAKTGGVNTLAPVGRTGDGSRAPSRAKASAVAAAASIVAAGNAPADTGTSHVSEEVPFVSPSAGNGRGTSNQSPGVTTGNDVRTTPLTGLSHSQETTKSAVNPVNTNQRELRSEVAGLAVGAAVAGAGVAAAVGSARGGEAGGADSGKARKVTKPSQWKQKFKSLFGRKAVKPGPTQASEESLVSKPATGIVLAPVAETPGVSFPQAEVGHVARQEERHVARSEPDDEDASWTGSVKEEEAPEGWSESGDSAESQRELPSLAPGLVRDAKLGPNGGSNGELPVLTTGLVGGEKVGPNEGAQREMEDVARTVRLGEESVSKREEGTASVSPVEPGMPSVGAARESAEPVGVAGQGSEQALGAEKATGKEGNVAPFVDTMEARSVAGAISVKLGATAEPRAGAGEVGPDIDEQSRSASLEENLAVAGAERGSAGSEAVQDALGDVSRGATGRNPVGGTQADSSKLWEGPGGRAAVVPIVVGPASTAVVGAAMVVKTRTGSGATSRAASESAKPVHADSSKQFGIAAFTSSGGNGQSGKAAPDRVSGATDVSAPVPAAGNRIALLALEPRSDPAGKVDLEESGKVSLGESDKLGFGEAGKEAWGEPGEVALGKTGATAVIRTETGSSRVGVWGEPEDDDEVTMQSPPRENRASGTDGWPSENRPLGLSDNAAWINGPDGSAARAERDPKPLEVSGTGGLAPSAADGSGGLGDIPSDPVEVGGLQGEAARGVKATEELGTQPRVFTAPAGTAATPVTPADNLSKPQGPNSVSQEEANLRESERPLPALQRSPSPELPYQWGSTSPEQNLVFLRVNAPPTVFQGASGALTTNPPDESASSTPVPKRGVTPTPASTPTTTLVGQFGFPPGPVKPVAKPQSPPSGGLPSPGNINPPAGSGTPEPSAFDAGFAKLRINLGAYQSPSKSSSSPSTPQTGFVSSSSPERGVPVEVEARETSEPASCLPSSAPAVMSVQGGTAGRLDSGALENVQREPHMAGGKRVRDDVAVSVSKEPSEEVDADLNVLTPQATATPSSPTTPTTTSHPPAAIRVLDSPAVPNQTAQESPTTPAVVFPAKTARALDLLGASPNPEVSRPPQKEPEYTQSDLLRPKGLARVPELAPNIPVATAVPLASRPFPEPSPLLEQLEAANAPVGFDASTANLTSSPAVESEASGVQLSPAPAVSAETSGVQLLSTPAVSLEGSEGTPAPTPAINLQSSEVQLSPAPAVGAEMSGVQLPTAAAASEDLGGLIKAAEVQLAEARRKLTTASPKQQDAGSAGSFIEEDGGFIEEDGEELGPFSTVPAETSAPRDASQNLRALSEAAAAAAAAATTLVGIQVAGNRALAAPSGLSTKPSEMEGKDLVTNWLDAEGIPLDEPRQQSVPAVGIPLDEPRQQSVPAQGIPLDAPSERSLFKPGGAFGGQGVGGCAGDVSKTEAVPEARTAGETSAVTPALGSPKVSKAPGSIQAEMENVTPELEAIGAAVSEAKGTKTGPRSTGLAASKSSSLSNEAEVEAADRSVASAEEGPIGTRTQMGGSESILCPRDETLSAAGPREESEFRIAKPSLGAGLVAAGVGAGLAGAGLAIGLAQNPISGAKVKPYSVPEVANRTGLVRAGLAEGSTDNPVGIAKVKPYSLSEEADRTGLAGVELAEGLSEDRINSGRRKSYSLKSEADTLQRPFRRRSIALTSEADDDEQSKRDSMTFLIEAWENDAVWVGREAGIEGSALEASVAAEGGSIEAAEVGGKARTPSETELGGSALKERPAPVAAEGGSTEAAEVGGEAQKLSEAELGVSALEERSALVPAKGGSIEAAKVGGGAQKLSEAELGVSALEERPALGPAGTATGGSIEAGEVAGGMEKPMGPSDVAVGDTATSKAVATLVDTSDFVVVSASTEEPEEKLAGTQSDKSGVKNADRGAVIPGVTPLATAPAARLPRGARDEAFVKAGTIGAVTAGVKPGYEAGLEKGTSQPSREDATGGRAVEPMDAEGPSDAEGEAPINGSEASEGLVVPASWTTILAWPSNEEVLSGTDSAEPERTAELVEPVVPEQTVQSVDSTEPEWTPKSMTTMEQMPFDTDATAVQDARGPDALETTLQNRPLAVEESVLPPVPSAAAVGDRGLASELQGVAKTGDVAADSTGIENRTGENVRALQGTRTKTDAVVIPGLMSAPRVLERESSAPEASRGSAEPTGEDRRSERSSGFATQAAEPVSLLESTVEPTTALEASDRTVETAEEEVKGEKQPPSRSTAPVAAVLATGAGLAAIAGGVYASGRQGRRPGGIPLAQLEGRQGPTGNSVFTPGDASGASGFPMEATSGPGVSSGDSPGASGVSLEASGGPEMSPGDSAGPSRVPLEDTGGPSLGPVDTAEASGESKSRKSRLLATEEGSTLYVESPQTEGLVAPPQGLALAPEFAVGRPTPNSMPLRSSGELVTEENVEGGPGEFASIAEETRESPRDAPASPEFAAQSSEPARAPVVPGKLIKVDHPLVAVAGPEAVVESIAGSAAEPAAKAAEVASESAEPAESAAEFGIQESGALLPGERKAVGSSLSEMEGKALATRWLAAQTGPVRTPRQQGSEEGDEPPVPRQQSPEGDNDPHVPRHHTVAGEEDLGVPGQQWAFEATESATELSVVGEESSGVPRQPVTLEPETELPMPCEQPRTQKDGAEIVEPFTAVDAANGGVQSLAEDASQDDDVSEIPVTQSVEGENLVTAPSGSEMEGKALVAQWLSAEEGVVSTPRQQGAEPPVPLHPSETSMPRHQAEAEVAGLVIAGQPSDVDESTAVAGEEVLGVGEERPGLTAPGKAGFVALTPGFSTTREGEEEQLLAADRVSQAEPSDVTIADPGVTKSTVSEESTGTEAEPVGGPPGAAPTNPPERSSGMASGVKPIENAATVDEPVSVGGVPVGVEGPVHGEVVPQPASGEAGRPQTGPPEAQGGSASTTGGVHTVGAPVEVVGPVHGEGVFQPVSGQAGGPETGPLEAQRESASGDKANYTVPLVAASVAAGLVSWQALRSRAVTPAVGSFPADVSQNRALDPLAPSDITAKAGQELRTSSNSPELRHVKKKPRAGQSEIGKILPDREQRTGSELPPVLGGAFPSQTAPPSAEADEFSSQSGPQLPVSSQVKPVVREMTFKAPETQLGGASVAEEALNIPTAVEAEGLESAALGPVTPPCTSSISRRVRSTDGVSPGAKGTAKMGREPSPGSAKGLPPARAGASPLKGGLRRQGSPSPRRPSPKTPRLKIVSPRISPVRQRVSPEMSRLPSTAGRRTRLTQLASPASKPRAANISPADARGEKENTRPRSIFSAWDEEEAGFMRGQLAGSRSLRERKARLEVEAERAALGSASFPARPYTSPADENAAFWGGELPPSARPFSSPPVDDAERRRLLQEQLRLVRNETRLPEVISETSREGEAVRDSGPKAGPVFGPFEGGKTGAETGGVELEKSPAKIARVVAATNAPLVLGSVALRGESSPGLRPLTKELLPAREPLRDTGGTRLSPLTKEISPVREPLRERGGKRLNALTRQISPARMDLKQEMPLGLSPQPRRVSPSDRARTPEVGTGLSPLTREGPVAARVTSGRALATSAVPEPTESLWEVAGSPLTVPETLPGAPSPAEATQDAPRKPKRLRFLRDLFRRKKKGIPAAPIPSQPAPRIETVVSVPSPPKMISPPKKASPTQRDRANSPFTWIPVGDAISTSTTESLDAANPGQLNPAGLGETEGETIEGTERVPLAVADVSFGKPREKPPSFQDASRGGFEGAAPTEFAQGLDSSRGSDPVGFDTPQNGGRGGGHSADVARPELADAAPSGNADVARPSIPYLARPESADVARLGAADVARSESADVARLETADVARPRFTDSGFDTRELRLERTGSGSSVSITTGDSPRGSFGGVFTSRQISARKPPLSPASRRVLKGSPGVQRPVARPSGLSPSRVSDVDGSGRVQTIPGVPVFQPGGGGMTPGKLLETGGSKELVAPPPKISVRDQEPVTGVADVAAIETAGVMGGQLDSTPFIMKDPALIEPVRGGQPEPVFEAGRNTRADQSVEEAQLKVADSVEALVPIGQSQPLVEPGSGSPSMTETAGRGSAPASETTPVDALDTPLPVAKTAESEVADRGASDGMKDSPSKATPRTVLPMGGFSADALQGGEETPANGTPRNFSPGRGESERLPERVAMVDGSVGSAKTGLAVTEVSEGGRQSGVSKEGVRTGVSSETAEDMGSETAPTLGGVADEKESRGLGAVDMASRGSGAVDPASRGLGAVDSMDRGSEPVDLAAILTSVKIAAQQVAGKSKSIQGEASDVNEGAGDVSKGTGDVIKVAGDHLAGAVGKEEPKAMGTVAGRTLPQEGATVHNSTVNDVGAQGKSSKMGPTVDNTAAPGKGGNKRKGGGGVETPASRPPRTVSKWLRGSWLWGSKSAKRGSQPVEAQAVTSEGLIESQSVTSEGRREAAGEPEAQERQVSQIEHPVVTPSVSSNPVTKPASAVPELELTTAAVTRSKPEGFAPPEKASVNTPQEDATLATGGVLERGSERAAFDPPAAATLVGLGEGGSEGAEKEPPGATKVVVDAPVVENQSQTRLPKETQEIAQAESQVGGVPKAGASGRGAEGQVMEGGNRVDASEAVGKLQSTWGGERARISPGGLGPKSPPNSVRTIKAVPIPQLDLGALSNLNDAPVSPLPGGVVSYPARAEFPLRYVPSEGVLSPSSRGSSLPGFNTPLPSPLSPLSKSKGRNVGSVPDSEEDIFTILDEKPKQGGGFESVWGGKAASKSRSRKRAGDISWASAKGIISDENEKKGVDLSLLSPPRKMEVEGDPKSGYLGQEDAPQKEIEKMAAGKERGPFLKPPSNRRRASVGKQNVHVAPQKDDTWDWSGEVSSPAGLGNTSGGLPGNTEPAEIPEEVLLAPSPGKSVGAQVGEKENKAKLSFSASEEESFRRPAIPFLYEQAMEAANEQLASPNVVGKESKLRPKKSGKRGPLKWPIMETDT